jgi:Lar family restriction alleviation protein
MSRLKPCPFCGGEAEYISNIDVHPILDENGAYIDADVFYYEATRCQKCGVGYESADADEPEGITIERWNRRADDE